MHRLMKRLYRERRRLGLVAVFTFVAGYIAFHHSTRVLFGLPFPVIAGLAFMIGLTAFLMLLVLLFPKIRQSAESVALSIPVLSLMGVFGPARDGGLASTTNVLGIMMCYLIFAVYGGQWLDRFLPCRPRALRSSATSVLSPEQVWPYLTVTPDTFSAYGSATVLSMEWVETGRSYRLIGRSGDLATIEEIHTIDVDAPHQRYRFTFHVPDATENAPVSSGSKEFRLVPHGTGTRLDTIRIYDAVSIRAQIWIWVDDAMGRLDDEVLESAEAAYHSDPPDASIAA